MKNSLNPQPSTLNPIVLCILDGVGATCRLRGNAVRRAKMPFWKGLMRKYPTMTLAAAGPAVGVPKGTMGNSEIGHIALGAGRTVDQYLRRFEKEDLARNKPLADFIKSIKSKDTVHVIGIASTGRVHADLADALKVAKIIKKAGKKIVWHFVSDGRDIDNETAPRYVRKIRRALGRDVVFGSLSGRYYTFDRDNNNDRTKLAFDAIYGGAKTEGITIDAAIKRSYKEGVTDEFIRPVRFQGAPAIGKSDGILFFNYRADRARQILKAFVKAGHRKFLCFSEYGYGLDKYCPALLPNIEVKNTLGDILAAHGISQLRLAETDKYNHVTYFFDAERAMEYPGEKKILVPSLKLAKFEIKPEMAAAAVTKEFLKNVGKFDVVIMNYANGDIIGHTGKFRETVRALEFLDECLKKIVPATLKLGGAVIVTSDHGNAEEMSDWRGRPWRGHSTNPVPFTLVSNDASLKLRRVPGAGLANVAPTMLKLLGLSPSSEMSEPLL